VILLGIYPWNIIILLLFGWLLSFKISTLKFPIMMIGQCLGDRWIIIWRLFRNVEIEHEWPLYTHTICINFCVLILKVVAIYNKPSLIIVLKKYNCMCTSYIIINPWPSWIEIYDEFINLCTFVDACYILVSMRNNIWNIWKLWSWLIFL